ncbi:MAG: DUF763 domain-containing protein [Myxococcota bacterium]
MGRSTGRADLPLHAGRVPPWLATRMAALGRVVVEALVIEFGRGEVLARLAHPFWFQSLGAVMGMDWHSSGITTSVLGALKRGLEPVAHELGLYVCGGRGKQSRKTPDELRAYGHTTGLDGDALARTSRLVAKVDNTAVQDGFQIYLHSFVLSADGEWAVVQQGMSPSTQTARRYHWLSCGLDGFFDDPHAAIDGKSGGEIRNLSDARASANRSGQLALVADGPDPIIAALERTKEPTPQLVMPGHHDVRPKDVSARRLYGTLRAAAEASPSSFDSLLLVPGVGPRTMASLAMVSEVIYGAPSRFTDPARFSLAHGGKDGHPFPVPLAVFDTTIRVTRNAVERAKLGRSDTLAAMEALDRQARAIERSASEEEIALVDVARIIEEERVLSHRYGGMTVNGPARKPAVRPQKKTSQLSFPGVE